MSNLIADIAQALARTDLTLAPETTRWMMQAVREHTGVDVAFIRLHDHRHRTTTLYAEWPLRYTGTEVDPLGVLHFDRSSPVISLQEHLSEVVELHGEVVAGRHRDLLAEARAKPVEALLLAPVRTRSDITIGVVGLASHTARQWTGDERDLLRTIASLLALTHARIVTEMRLRRGVDRDALTGLPDRTALLEHLGSRLATSGSAPVTPLMVRFSDVGNITDRLGHDALDEFMVSVADRFRVALLGTGTVFRASNDEFVVVPSHGGTADARRLAVGLRTVLEAPLPVRGESVVPRITIGIASAFSDAPDPVALLRGLRLAVTHARSDAGAISVLNRNIVRTATRRNEIEAGIRDAIVHGSLRLDYQPEVDLRTRKIVGMEALVRWDHPTLGELSPDSFIDVVDSMDLAEELGNWVLRSACAEVGGWRAEGFAAGTLLRVNVSPRQLVDPDFVRHAADVLNDNGLDPGALCVEFTEDVALHDIDAVRTLVTRLQQTGIKVAIDDFGTGYSGFTRLKALHVDAVKIDKSFVRDVDVNLHDRAIIGAITAMAAAFEIDVIAEGVETEGAAATLLELGCTYAQGFLFARPMTGPDLRRLLQADAEMSAG